MKPVLILGIGNILMGDDGAGVRTVEWLIENASHISGDVELLDGGTAGLDLLPHLQGRERILVIDAALTADPPGTVRSHRPDELKHGPSLFSLHQAGILDVLKMLSLTGGAPEVEIITLAVSGAGDTLRLSLSPEVARAVPVAALRVLDSLNTTPFLINQG